MKYLLKKSKMLIFFFVMTGFLLTIAATSIQTSLQLILTPQDFLTSPYARLTVVREQDGPKMKELTNFLLAHFDDFVFYKIRSGAQGKELCYRGDLFDPNVIEGESISEEDIAEGRDVALVSQEFYLNFLREHPEQTVMHDGKVFEVKGVYSTRDRSDTPIVEGRFYVNMNGSGAAAQDIEGEYYFASKNLEFDLEILADFFAPYKDTLSYTFDIVKQETVPLLLSAIETNPFLYLSLLLTLVLLLLHISTMTGLWYQGRMYEISVRRLCGATMPAIFMMLSRDYLILFSMSYLTGWFLAAVMLLTGLFPFVGPHIYIFSSLLAYLTCLLIGITIGGIALYRKVKRLDIGALN